MEVLSSLKLQEIAMLVPQDPFMAMRMNNLFRELWDLSWTLVLLTCFYLHLNF